MKKIFKILLVTLIALLAVCTMFACSSGAGGEQSGGLPPVIEGDVGEYMPPYNAAYGEEPDLDNVIIDGYLDDELWTADTMKWYTHYEANPRIKYEMASTVSDGGVYIAFRSYDPIVAWGGYNYFFRNTNVKFYLYVDEHGGNNINFTMDANNINPGVHFINARSQYYGELNFAGKGEGISCEVFVTWADMGVETTDGAPEYIAILPVYNYCTTPVVQSTTTMFPTFVKTTGNRKQAIEFDKNGYMQGTDEDSIIGSHNSGLAKTNGWTIEGKGKNETATSNSTATAGFPQVAFFRDKLSSIFKVTTTIEFGPGNVDSRAGIIIYRDSINYRAVALQFGGKDHEMGDDLFEYKLRGYTNYPANITMTSKVYDAPSAYGYSTADLTVYNNMGKLYYVIDGEFVGSESAPYISTNNYIGLYAFDTTTKFSDYKCTTFATEQELLEDFSDYAYTVDVYNEDTVGVVAQTDQLAVSKENGKVTVTLNFNSGYTVGDIDYSVDGGERVSAMEYAETAMGGVFTMPVDGNVIIYTTAQPMDEDELVTVDLESIDLETGDKVTGVTATLIGDGCFTRYSVRVDGVKGTAQIPAGYKWTYVATGAGYRETDGVVLDGAKIDVTPKDPIVLYVKSLTIGGTALPPTDENGANIISFTKTSVTGSVYDISKGEEGLVVFQTAQADTGEIYFSGRTISDYQVAYVEITNRTDPTAFTSLENDPAAGFLIAGPKGTSYVGARVDGLRIIPNKLVFSEREDLRGVLGWNGYLANTDRVNGGRFLSGYEGIGSVNRIPHDGVEYTTSLMLVRKGGYTYIYAADGRAGVLQDKTNFNKMKLVHSYYNSMTDGYAAVGIGTTCWYNLRMDFENYWIICGDRASQFIGSDIERSFVVNDNGADVTIGGSGLVKYDEQTGAGKMIKSAELTVKANSIAENKMLRISASTGETYYLYKKGDVISYTQNGTPTKLTLTVEEVEYDVISGKVNAPEGTKSRIYYGSLYNSAGSKIMDVETKADGTFEYRIEKGESVMVDFDLDGYAMDPVLVSAQPVELNFTEIPLTTKLTMVGGSKGTASEYVNYGYNTTDGAYFTVGQTINGSGYVYLKDTETYENMVIDMKYERRSAPSGQTVDSDFSFGATFYGQSGSYGMKFIEDGYRILQDDRFHSGFSASVRGLGGANMKPLVTPQPYNLRFIKIGSVVYMCSKVQSADKYVVVFAFDLMPYVGTIYTNVALTWTSVGYVNVKVSDINVTEITSATIADYASELRGVDFAFTGATDYLSARGIGVISYDEQIKTGLAVPGMSMTVTAKNLPDGKMLKISSTLSEKILQNGESLDLLMPKGGSEMITASLVDGFFVSGSVVAPDGVTTKKFKGGIRDVNGTPMGTFETDNNGKFSVFVDKAGEYYVHIYLDGYVNTPVKLEEGKDINGITLKKVAIVSSITKVDGTVDPAPWYDVPVYEKVNGSLCFDVKDDFAQVEGMFIRPELITDKVQITYTLERRAKPETSSATEDGDASMGMQIYGTKASYGARLIGTGYRIMVNDGYNVATNIEKREGSPIDMKLINMPEPYNFKFIKDGRYLEMYAKLQSQSQYTLVYTLDTMGSHHSVGSEKADLAISWCYWGFADVTISDIVVTDLSK